MNLLIFIRHAHNIDIDASYNVPGILYELGGFKNIYICDPVHEETESVFDGTQIDRIPVYRAGTDFARDHVQYEKVEYVSPKDIDAVWMRIDPPLTDAFCRNIVENFKHALVINDPQGAKFTGSKIFLQDIMPLMDDLMAGTQICENLSDFEKFAQTHEHIVLKASESSGGKGVKLYSKTHEKADFRDSEPVEKFIKESGKCLAMEFLESHRQSDKRVLVINGQIFGSMRRMAKEGDWICNISKGGSYEISDERYREVEMVKRLNPIMEENGVYYYGIDTLLNSKEERVLSEINTHNPGGLAHLDEDNPNGERPFQTRFAKMLIEMVEAKKAKLLT